jgi:hypothetical protein
MYTVVKQAESKMVSPLPADMSFVLKFRSSCSAHRKKIKKATQPVGSSFITVASRKSYFQV